MTRHQSAESHYISRIGWLRAASTQLYGDIFAAWSKSFEPLVARVADGPERLFRALAD